MTGLSVLSVNMRETISCVSDSERERGREEGREGERASLVLFIASNTDRNHAEIPQSTENPVCGNRVSGDHS